MCCRRLKRYKDFKETLRQVALHPNAHYFILKSIIVNNLYGVDIMEEACEICKLRLFLKLVAQVEEGVGGIEKIEPLPDIDFNIRAGNTLVGFTTLDAVREAMSSHLDFGKGLQRFTDQAEQAATAFRMFRQMHTRLNVEAKELADGKRLLRSRLDGLHEELNRYLAEQFDQGSSKTAMEKWTKSHQPFHWLVDFYSIVAGGGFDVVIGNPPYVRASNVKYLSSADRAMALPDLYAYVLLRTLELAKPNARCSMIVPLSLSFGEDFALLRRKLTSKGTSWYSSFDNIPAALFAGVSQRCTIWIAANGQGSPSVFSTRLHRWRAGTRGSLFATLRYAACNDWRYAAEGIPRIDTERQLEIARTISDATKGGLPLLIPSRKAKYFIGFAPAARNFVSGYIDPPPVIDVSTLKAESTDCSGTLGLPDQDSTFAALAIIVGELHFWHWLVHGDGFHVINGTVAEMIESLGKMSSESRIMISRIGKCLHLRRHEALVFKKNAGKYVGNYNFRGHAAYTRRSDLLLLTSLGYERAASLEVFGHVQRLLAINESAGEKSIPVEVKAMYPTANVDADAEMILFSDVDGYLRRKSGFSQKELLFLLNQDVVYGAGAHDD